MKRAGLRVSPRSSFSGLPYGSSIAGAALSRGSSDPVRKRKSGGFCAISRFLHRF